MSASESSGFTHEQSSDIFSLCCIEAAGSQCKVHADDTMVALPCAGQSTSPHTSPGPAPATVVSTCKGAWQKFDDTEKFELALTESVFQK